MIERIVEFLTSVRSRKPMHLETVDAAAAMNFLHGFRVGCMACGFDLPPECCEQATTGRGWEWSAAGTAGQMRERGLSEEAIADELLAIEIEAWSMWSG
jgi:hypothetical protein